MNYLIFSIIPVAIGLSIYYWSEWQIAIQKLDAKRISFEYEKQNNKMLEELLVMYKDKIISMGLKEASESKTTINPKVAAKIDN